MLHVTSNINTPLSSDLILLLNQTPQNINVVQCEGQDDKGIYIFRIVFLNSFSLKTPEASYFLGKIVHDVNPDFLENGVYEALISVYNTSESQTIIYDIDFLGKTHTIEALIIKMGNYLVSYSQDITSRLNKEHLLIAKNELINDAHKLLDMGTWELDLNTKIITSSFNLGGFFELPNNSYTITLDQYYSLLFTENLSETIQNFNALINAGNSFFLERRYTTQSGKDKYIEITGKPVFEQSVCNKVIGTFRDISTRKHHELDLAKNELILNEAKEILKMCTWSYNPSTQKSVYSKELSEILEYENPIELNSFDEYLSYIHPDDKAMAKENFNKTIATSEYNFKADRKIITQKGNTKYIEIVGRSIVKNGKVKRVFGTIRDITEKKIKDIELLESEKELIAARNLLTMGSVRFDYKNNYFYISPELSHILELDELKPFIEFEEWWQYVAPEEKEKSKQNFYSGKHEPLPVVEKIERKFISAKGNTKYVEFLFEANIKQPFLFTGTFRDITEKKIEELKLLQAQKELLEARALLKMGTWSFDLINQTVYYSKELSQILNYPTPIEFYDFEQFFAHVHADDKSLVNNNYKNIIDSSKKDYLTTVDRKMVDYFGKICFLEINTKIIVHKGVKVSVHGTFRDITEKKIKDLKIQESELRLKDAQKLSKIGSWQIDIKSKQINFSPEVILLFGNNLDTSISFEDYFKINVSNTATPFEDSFYKLLQQTQQFKTIHHFVFKNGNEYYVEVIGHTSVNKNNEAEIVGTYRDITEQYKIDEALKESEERYKLLFDHNPTMYFTLDDHHKLLSVNQFGLNYLNYSQSEVLFKNFTTLYPIEERKKAIRNIELLKQSYSNFWQWEIRKRKKNGDLFWAKETGRVAKNKAGQNIYLIISEDISDEVEQRELIKIKQNELVLAKNAAEAAAKEKQQFASIMSHEIRSPLNAVIGITNLLLLEDPKPEQLEELNTLKFAGENLLMLVNDILDFNKIEAGKLQLEKTIINLNLLVKNLHNTFAYKANEKNIELRSNVDTDLPEAVLGDPTRIAQILTNLLSNAIKFTSTGFVELSLRKMKSHESDLIKIRFEVSDSGIGIPKNKHKLIFESFSQANTDTNRKFGGTGLGLTITKKLIELHQSEIFLQSEEGKGTVFYFDLLLPIKNNNSYPELADGKTQKAKDLVGKQILLVEDNPFNQLIAIKFLEKWEANVDVADNGLVALKKLETASYDIILMDIQMPEMNGVECTHAIRKSENETLRKIPIIAFTAAADTEKDKMIAEGMNDSISKPFNPAELYNKLLLYI